MDTKSVVISTGIIGAVVTGALIFWNWMNPKFEDLDKEFDYVEGDEPIIVRKDTGDIVTDKTEVQLALERMQEKYDKENK